MKKETRYLLYGIFFLLIVPIFIFPQDQDESSVKDVLQKILDYSKTKTYDKAALLIAYNGEDKSRIGTDTFNPSNQEDLNQVKRICKKISALIELSEQYSVNKIEVAKPGDKVIYKISVGFKSGSQVLNTSFEFIKLPKGYALLTVN